MDVDKSVVPIRSDEVISQSDLGEFIALTERMRSMEVEWKRRRDSLVKKLRHGVRVQPGIYEAFLSKLIVR